MGGMSRSGTREAEGCGHLEEQGRIGCKKRLVLVDG
jgi:hypothetical protein